MHDNQCGDRPETSRDADADRRDSKNGAAGARADNNSDSLENGQHSRTERRRQVTAPSSSDDTDKRGEVSPAHWQGEPLPYGSNEQTQDVGFDQRGAGRARQYGRAGAYGERHNQQERRPLRGETRSDKDLLGALHDAFHDSGLDVSNVSVTVDNGVVHLSGHIAHGDDKYALERLAVNCHGTIAVQNQLDVGTPSPDDSAA